MSGVLCVAKLRSGSPCRSAATDGQFCAYHAALADHLGNDAVANGDHTKQRNPRQRERVLAGTEPLQPNASTSKSPSAVRPALALTAMEELEDDPLRPSRRRDQHNKRNMGDLHLPRVRQGVPGGNLVPDHGARIKAIQQFFARGSVGSERPSSSSRRFRNRSRSSGISVRPSRTDGRAGVRGADPRGRR